MAPLILLFVVMLASRLAGTLGVTALASWPTAIALGLTAMFTMTGIVHFLPRRRAGLVAIVPPGLGHASTLVTLTGLLELVGAAWLLAPTNWGFLRAASAWGLCVLLILMFPANMYAAGSRRSKDSPHTPVVRRALIQVMFVAATLFVALHS